MNGPSTLPELSPLTAALRRAARARTKEIAARAALWVWLTATSIWLLPVGPWAAPGLPVGRALATGALLSLCGAALVLLHHVASGTAAIRAAIDEAARLPGGGTGPGET